MPKLDKWTRFRNLFWRIWSQDQDLELKLKSSILTRRGAPAGTCPGAFRTAMCWDPWFLKFTKTYIICCYNRNIPHPRTGQKTRVWELFLQILISESRSRAKTCGSRTNSARRVHWYPFCPKFPPYLSETWFGILGVGAPFPPYGVA